MTTAHGETSWWPEVTFGDRLRIVRRGKRRTQDEMAGLLGVKQGAYAAWESGRNHPTHKEIVGVAKRIEMLDGVPTGWTLGVLDYQAPPTPNGGLEVGPGPADTPKSSQRNTRGFAAALVAA